MLLHTAHPPHSDEEKANPPVKRGESRSTKVSSNHWTAVPVCGVTHPHGSLQGSVPAPGVGGHKGPEDFPHARAWLPHPPGPISNLHLGFPSFPRAAFMLIKSAAPVEGGHQIPSGFPPCPGPPAPTFHHREKKKIPGR